LQADGSEYRHYDWVFIEGALTSNPYKHPNRHTVRVDEAGDLSYLDGHHLSFDDEFDYGCASLNTCNWKGKCQLDTMTCKCFPGNKGSKCSFDEAGFAAE
jgi:hypothetical protein